LWIGWGSGIVNSSTSCRIRPVVCRGRPPGSSPDRRRPAGRPCGCPPAAGPAPRATPLARWRSSPRPARHRSPGSTSRGREAAFSRRHARSHSKRPADRGRPGHGRRRPAPATAASRARRRRPVRPGRPGRCTATRGGRQAGRALGVGRGTTALKDRTSYPFLSPMSLWRQPASRPRNRPDFLFSRGRPACYLPLIRPRGSGSYG
jgi:hypothetical protein